jgi:hypothetical protein
MRNPFCIKSLKKGNLRETIPMHKELKKGLEQKLLKRLNDEGGR